VASTTDSKTNEPIQHPNETRSNEIRQRASRIEPRSLRTYTPSLAVMARSSGAFQWTLDDRKLADFTSGVLVANLGHNPSAWWRRVLEYLKIQDVDTQQPFLSCMPLSSYNALTELEVLASERLVANLQKYSGSARMEQVMWAASGSEAIQKSLWAALARHPGEDIILATRHGFHGKKGLAGATTGSESDSERDPRVRFISFPMEGCIDEERRQQPLDLAPFQKELDDLSSEFGSRICCLITEPYIGGGGSYHPQPEYQQLLQQFCRDHDALYILDEVQASFGRTGPMYAFSRYGVEPDIVCVGKGLGNGIPVSAAIAPTEIWNSLNYGEGSDTWSGNPLSSAAVLATLDEFESNDVVGQGQKLSEVLAAGLTRLKETGVIQYVRGEGCVWGIECGGVGNHHPNEVANACVETCYLGDSEGNAIHLLGPLAGKVLRVSPPLVMDEDDARHYLNVMFNLFTDLHRRLSA